MTTGAVSATMHIPPWSGARAQKALEQVRSHGSKNEIPCWICKLEIDYRLRFPHPQACTVQHIKSRHQWPHLTWDPHNWAPAHADCNSGERPADRDGLGVTTDW